MSHVTELVCLKEVLFKDFHTKAKHERLVQNNSNTLRPVSLFQISDMKTFPEAEQQQQRVMRGGCMASQVDHKLSF